MATILEQQKKKTFKDIAPLWDYVIKCHKDSPGLNMTWYDRCIVGEAHGFRDYHDEDGIAYGCKDCKRFADRFMQYVGLDNQYRYSVYDQAKFEEQKAKFVDHWNKKHVEANTKAKANV